MTIHSKNKGNSFERAIAIFLRERGYEARTAREQSKALDDSGIDILDNTPFNFQLKHVERMTTSYHDLLKTIPTNKPPVILHKRNHKGTVAVLSLHDFAKLLLPTLKKASAVELNQKK